MKVKAQGILLTATSKPYDIEGNKGVSHRVRVLCTDQIFSVRASEEEVTELKKYEGQEGEVTIDFISPKENLQALFIDFEPTESN